MERDLNNELNINIYTIKNFKVYFPFSFQWWKHRNTYIMNQSKEQILHFPLTSQYCEHFYYFGREKVSERQEWKQKIVPFGKTLIRYVLCKCLCLFIYLVGDFCIDAKTFTFYHYFPVYLWNSAGSSIQK